MKGHVNIEADALSRLQVIEEDNSIETMLNHTPLDPHNHLLKKYPFDLALLCHRQQLDQALMTPV